MPPKARRIPHAITAHGDTRIDNYYWLRDDNRSQPEVLDYLRRMLEEQGATVTTAGNAGEALAVLSGNQHERFDVMLTDIGMPGMDGYGLVRTLRDDLAVSAKALPAVAVTALARADDRRRALSSGFQEHVAKPYSVAQLVAAVRHVRSADAVQG